MRKFIFKADVEFFAEDIDDAFLILGMYHLALIKDGGAPTPYTKGESSLKAADVESCPDVDF